MSVDMNTSPNGLAPHFDRIKHRFGAERFPPKNSKETLPNLQETRIVILDMTTLEPTFITIAELHKRPKESYTIPVEVFPFMKGATQQKVSADEMQGAMQSIFSSYLEMARVRREGARSAEPTIRSLQSTDFSSEKAAKREALWSSDNKKVEVMAAQLHQGYQTYHRSETRRVESVLREYTDKNKKLRVIDLMQARYADLPPQWKDVNKISARNILTIIETMVADTESLKKIETGFKLSQDQDFVFAINTALYNVWSQRGEKNKENRQQNPLFLLKDYREMRQIAENKEPTDGWQNFLKKYRLFLADNSQTYARILKQLPNFTNSSESAEQRVIGSSSEPVSMGEKVADIRAIDKNEDQKISLAEINAIQDSKLMEMIIEQAKLELDKDRHMMVAYLLNIHKIFKV